MKDKKEKKHYNIGNKYALGNKGGAPRKYTKLEDIVRDIETYLNKTKIEKWTITGLAIALDMTRSTLIEYVKRNNELSNAVKKAKAMVEHSYELDLRKRGHAGDIFALKNFNWSDKQEIEHSGSISLKELSRVSKEK